MLPRLLRKDQMVLYRQPANKEAFMVTATIIWLGVLEGFFTFSILGGLIEKRLSHKSKKKEL